MTPEDIAEMKQRAEDHKEHRDGLWRYGTEGIEKYLVIRRDGSRPQWPYFVIAGADPAAPAAFRAYADECERLGMNSQYVSDVRRMAAEFDLWRSRNATGDPDGRRHRKDDAENAAKTAREWLS